MINKLCLYYNNQVPLINGPVANWVLAFGLYSKLTRESGTDFPIPSVPPSPDHETLKLIREKDEEVSDQSLC